MKNRQNVDTSSAVKLVIENRRDYPFEKPLPPHLDGAVIRSVGGRRLDSRILRLMHLSVLSVEKASISSISRPAVFASDLPLPEIDIDKEFAECMDGLPSGGRSWIFGLVGRLGIWQLSNVDADRHVGCIEQIHFSSPATGSGMSLVCFRHRSLPLCGTGVPVLNHFNWMLVVEGVDEISPHGTLFASR
ncbi:leucine rich repeat protein 1 [Echinococcus multilocularis]|nr:leucine rich repeat protein 1 [Echinococcus multilocularis]